MARKPTWPYPKETTLTANPNGQWSKKFKGKVYYFGVWADPAAALQDWRDRWPIITGRGEVKRVAAGGLRVKEACEVYLAHRFSEHQAGDIEWSTYRELRAVCVKVAAVMGGKTLRAVNPEDFSALMIGVSSRSPIARANFSASAKRVFAWIGETHDVAFDFGPAMKRPPAKAMRRQRNQRVDKTLDADHIHKLLGVADDRTRAILLLGINGGYGNKDVAMLETADINMSDGIIDHFRHKTEARRVVPLWPETIIALRAVDLGDPLAFPDANGLPIVRRGTHGVCRLMESLRNAVGGEATYYGFRYTFATIAAETGDDHARRLIMGHVIDGVSENYVRQFPRDRLVKVTDHVRQWLYSAASGGMENL